MTLFDKDASEFLTSLTYPKTLGQIYTALCDFVGVSYASSTFDYSTTSYSSSPFSDTSCTLRDILWWIAERARKVAHFNRVGQLELIDIGSDPVENLTASDIGQDGYSIAEYVTPKVTGVLLKGMNGASLTFGTLDTAYVISENPFIPTISNDDLNAYRAIPTYVPFECEVLEADPSIDVGDLINIRPAVEDISALTDVYGQIYAVPVVLTKPGTDTAYTKGTTVLARIEALAVESPTYSIPLMERELRFVGGIRAKYVATGNEEREADISDTEYNANVAFNQSRDYADSQTDALDESFDQQKVFNRLKNNGQAQGIYLDNGKIYINAEYIQTGTLSANYINGGTISGSSISLGSGNFVVDGSTGAVTIKSGSINLGSGVFTVSNAGAVSASNLSITGGRISVQGSAMNDGRVEVSYLTSPTAPYSEYKSILQPAMLINRLVVNYGNGTITQQEADVRYDRLQFVDGGTDLSSYEDVMCTIKSGNGSFITILPPSTSGKYITIQPVVVSTW